MAGNDENADLREVFAKLRVALHIRRDQEMALDSGKYFLSGIAYGLDAAMDVINAVERDIFNK